MRVKRWSEILGYKENYVRSAEKDVLAEIVSDFVKGSTKTREYNGKKVKLASEFGEISELATYIKNGNLPLEDIIGYITTPNGYERVNILELLDEATASQKRILLNELAVIAIDSDNIKSKNNLYSVIESGTIYLVLRNPPFGSGYSGFVDIEKAIYNRVLKNEIDWVH